MNKSTYCYGNLICRLFLWKVMLLHCDISACFPETTTRRGNHISRLRYRFLEVPFSEFLGNPTEKGTFERRCCKSANSGAHLLTSSYSTGGYFTGTTMAAAWNFLQLPKLRMCKALPLLSLFSVFMACTETNLPLPYLLRLQFLYCGAFGDECCEHKQSV